MDKQGSLNRKVYDIVDWYHTLTNTDYLLNKKHHRTFRRFYYDHNEPCRVDVFMDAQLGLTVALKPKKENL